MVSAFVIAVIGLVAVWVGLQGILSARKIAAKTPNAPMAYPVRLPWLHKRKTVATTVFRVGQIYTMAGCLMCALGAGTWLKTTSDDRIPACEAMASLLLSVSSETVPLTVNALSKSEHGCVHDMTDSGGGTWFRIESQSSADPIGEQFNSKVQELERNGMAVKPIVDGFQRAVVGMPGDESRAPTTLVIEDSRGLHSVEVHPDALEHKPLSVVLQILRHRPPNDP